MIPKRAALPPQAEGASMTETEDGVASGHGRIVASGFRPHPLLVNPHQQTLVPYFLRSRVPLDLRTERWELDDGDFVDLGWSGEHNTGAPIAVLVHGLGGGFESKYLRGLASRLNRRGWRTALLQLRGGGAEPNRLPRCYHHGDTADLRHVWRRLREQQPHSPLASVGWSLGGSVLLRALAEEGAQAPVDVAAAASVPFQLQACAEHMRRGFARLYQRHLLGALKDIVRRKHAALPLTPPADVEAALAARDFFAFDEAFTAPINGFRDARDYYERASSGAVLGDIRRPTLIVQALDDPFMPPSVVPPETALSPEVTLELSPSGGHVGFVGAGAFGQLDWWLERRLADYLHESVFRRRCGERLDNGASGLAAA